jgi:hypothetical protein
MALLSWYTRRRKNLLGEPSRESGFDSTGGALEHSMQPLYIIWAICPACRK